MSSTLINLSVQTEPNEKVLSNQANLLNHPNFSIHLIQIMEEINKYLHNYMCTPEGPTYCMKVPLFFSIKPCNNPPLKVSGETFIQPAQQTEMLRAQACKFDQPEVFPAAISHKITSPTMGYLVSNHLD